MLHVHVSRSQEHTSRHLANDRGRVARACQRAYFNVVTTERSAGSCFEKMAEKWTKTNRFATFVCQIPWNLAGQINGFAPRYNFKIVDLSTMCFGKGKLQTALETSRSWRKAKVGCCHNFSLKIILAKILSLSISTTVNTRI